jgi:hypothetical protein
VRKWRATGSFNQFIVWDHDMLPAESANNHLKMLELIRISELMVRGEFYRKIVYQ